MSEHSELNSNRMTNPISYWIESESFPHCEESNADKQLYRNLEPKKNSKMKTSMSMPYSITRHFTFIFIQKMADKNDNWVWDEYKEDIFNFSLEESRCKLNNTVNGEGERMEVKRNEMFYNHIFSSNINIKYSFILSQLEYKTKLYLK